MQKLRITLAIIGFILIFLNLIFVIDYSNLSFGHNRGGYLNLLVGLLIIVSQIGSYIYATKHDQAT